MAELLTSWWRRVCCRVLSEVALPPSLRLLRRCRVLGELDLPRSTWCPRRRSLLGHPVELPLSSWVPRRGRVLGEVEQLPKPWRRRSSLVVVAVTVPGLSHRIVRDD